MVINNKKDISRRQKAANQYTELLKDKFITPIISEDSSSVWAQYSIRVSSRDIIQLALKEKGIPTAIHYPLPLHLQECFKYLGYKKGDFPISELISKEILSLPMNPYIQENEIEFVCSELIALTELK